MSNRQQYTILLNGYKGYRTNKIERKGSEHRGKVLWNSFAVFGNIGISIVVPLTGGALIGKYLDTRFGYHSQLTLIGISIGFIISIVNLIMTLRSFISKTK